MNVTENKHISYFNNNEYIHIFFVLKLTVKLLWNTIYCEINIVTKAVDKTEFKIRNLQNSKFSFLLNLI